MPDGTPEFELDPVRAWRKDELDPLPRAAMLRGRKIYER
jgi:hypothetical protein